MTIDFIKNAFGWGFLVWLIGYGLGIALFIVVPPSLIGWIITPVGIALSLWILFKKVEGTSLTYYAWIGIVWLFIAVAFDYFFLYKAFNPPDGYYKFDIYLYYTLTLILPLIVGWVKLRGKAAVTES